MYSTPSREEYCRLRTKRAQTGEENRAGSIGTIAKEPGMARRQLEGLIMDKFINQ